MESNQVKKRKRRIIVAVLICISLLLGNVATILAAEDGLLIPTDDQYLELKAVQAKEVTGQNKQVIMQLWGHNLEFRRI